MEVTLAIGVKEELMGIRAAMRAAAESFSGQEGGNGIPLRQRSSKLNHLTI
jgi:hypothetical protein